MHQRARRYLHPHDGPPTRASLIMHRRCLTPVVKHDSTTSSPPDGRLSSQALHRPLVLSRYPRTVSTSSRSHVTVSLWCASQAWTRISRDGRGVLLGLWFRPPSFPFSGHSPWRTGFRSGEHRPLATGTYFSVAKQAMHHTGAGREETGSTRTVETHPVQPSNRSTKAVPVPPRTVP